MAVRHNENCIKTLNEEKASDGAFRAAVMFLFTQQAEQGAVPTEFVVANSAALLPWAADALHEVGCIRRCPETGGAFICTTSPSKAKNKILPSQGDCWELIPTK